MYEKFRQLHQPGSPFLLANVWDLGSAQVMAALGARAVATSSAAYAFTRGLPDGTHVPREAAIAHAAELAGALDIPVQADLENGYGPRPEDCAETVRLAAEAGIAGLCIEDIDLPGSAAYPFDLAVARIEAAAEAARGAGILLTARADGLMLGAYGCEEAIARLRAFEAAGAECLYAPLPASWADLERIAEAVTAPLNVLLAGAYVDRPRADYAALGAARLSLGSSLARLTHQLLLDQGSALLEGRFDGLSAAANGAEIDALLARGRARGPDRG